MYWYRSAGLTPFGAHLLIQKIKKTRKSCVPAGSHREEITACNIIMGADGAAALYGKVPTLRCGRSGSNYYYYVYCSYFRRVWVVHNFVHFGRLRTRLRPSRRGLSSIRLPTRVTVV